jgi:hypothetical protein
MTDTQQPERECPDIEYHDENAMAGYQGNRCKHNDAIYGHCNTARQLKKCPRGIP